MWWETGILAGVPQNVLSFSGGVNKESLRPRRDSHSASGEWGCRLQSMRPDVLQCACVHVYRVLSLCFCVHIAKCWSMLQGNPEHVCMWHVCVCASVLSVFLSS